MKVRINFKVTLLAIFLAVASLSTWMGASMQDMLIANASSLQATQAINYQSDEPQISQSEKLKRKLMAEESQVEEIASYGDFDYSLPSYSVDAFEKDEKGNRIETNTQSGGIVTNGDYFTSNILSVAKVGDIAVMETGFGGILGHSAIVVEVTSTKIITIEAMPTIGVQYQELDSFRFFNDGTTLFRVNTNAGQINLAVSWLKSQIDKAYTALTPSLLWNVWGWGTNCSTLTWGAYYYAGINITGEPLNEVTFIMPRSIRDKGAERNYLIRKEVYYNGYEFTNQKSGKAMDVPDGKVSDGKDLWQYPRNNTLAQIFIEVTTSERYSTPSLYDTKYLSFLNPNYYVHIERPFWPWEDTNANDRFIEIVNSFMDYADDHSIFWFNNNQFRTALSGYTKAIHVRGASTADKAALVTWDRGNDPQSKWNKRSVAIVSFNFY